MTHEQQAAERRIQDLQAELLHTSRLSVMGQMASTMAHELNQPLTAIMNYLEAARHLLQKDPQSAERVGLSICREIIEAHQGMLAALPNPSGGTVFRLTLPMPPGELALEAAGDT